MHAIFLRQTEEHSLHNRQETEIFDRRTDRHNIALKLLQNIW